MLVTVASIRLKAGAHLLVFLGDVELLALLTGATTLVWICWASSAVCSLSNHASVRQVMDISLG